MMTDQQEQGVSGVGEAIMGAVTCTDDNCGDGGGGVEEPQGGGGIRVPSSMSALSAAQVSGILLPPTLPFTSS